MSGPGRGEGGCVGWGWGRGELLIVKPDLPRGRRGGGGITTFTTGCKTRPTEGEEGGGDHYLYHWL